RDAKEELVLAHVWNKLANVVQILTIHIFKDDWLRQQTHQFLKSQTMGGGNIGVTQASPAILTPVMLTSTTKLEDQQQQYTQVINPTYSNTRILNLPTNGQ
ncbi:unnamed protein product, partial [Didymodactylos carnosus]